MQAYRYGAFGEVVASSGTLTNEFQDLGLHGVMADGNGLLHMNARYYSPEVRQFLTEDPIGLAGGANLYAYADGDPVNRVDPSGTQSVPAGWMPEAYDAVRTFIEEGVSLGLRDVGAFHPDQWCSGRDFGNTGRVREVSEWLVDSYFATTNTTNLGVMHRGVLEYRTGCGQGLHVVMASHRVYWVRCLRELEQPVDGRISGLGPRVECGQAVARAPQLLDGRACSCHRNVRQLG